MADFEALRITQQPHLPAAIVEIVLAGDIPSGGRQQAGDGVAQHRAPGVANGQRASRVGADELNLRLATLPSVRVPKTVGCGSDRRHLLRQPRVRKREVDEARMRQFHLADELSRREMIDKRFGDLDRRHFGQPR